MTLDVKKPRKKKTSLEFRPEAEVVFITPGGKLMRSKWNKKGRYEIYDVTDEAPSFLFQECVLAPGVRVADVFSLVAKHLDFFAVLLRNNWAREIISEWKGQDVGTKQWKKSPDGTTSLRVGGTDAVLDPSQGPTQAVLYWQVCHSSGEDWLRLATRREIELELAGGETTFKTKRKGVFAWLEKQVRDNVRKELIAGTYLASVKKDAYFASFTRPHFHGESVATEDSYQSYSGDSESKYLLASKGEQINWSLVGMHSLEIAALTLTLRDTITIIDEDVNPFEEVDGVRTVRNGGATTHLNPQFSLAHIIDGIFWELSFFGSPKKRDETVSEMKESCSEAIASLSTKTTNGKKSKKSKLVKISTE